MKIIRPLCIFSFSLLSSSALPVLDSSYLTSNLDIISSESLISSYNTFLNIHSIFESTPSFDSIPLSSSIISYSSSAAQDTLESLRNLINSLFQAYHDDVPSPSSLLSTLSQALDEEIGEDLDSDYCFYTSSGEPQPNCLEEIDDVFSDQDDISSYSQSNIVNRPPPEMYDTVVIAIVLLFLVFCIILEVMEGLEIISINQPQRPNSYFCPSSEKKDLDQIMNDETTLPMLSKYHSSTEDHNKSVDS